MGASDVSVDRELERSASPGQAPCSLLVIDDVDLVIQGLVAMLEPFDDSIRIAGTIGGVLQPIAADVALVDASGPPQAGIERIQEVLAMGSCDRVVLYTWRSTAASSAEAIERGAAGVFSKAAPAPVIARDLARINAGERVVHEFSNDRPLPKMRVDDDVDLTERDQELLVFVARGLNNAEIGRAMFLAESTVKTYLKRIYRKLGINTRAQAVMRAVELGIARRDNVSDLRMSQAPVVGPGE